MVTLLTGRAAQLQMRLERRCRPEFQAELPCCCGNPSV